MRIALAANGRMGLGLLRALQGSEHEVVALVRDGRQSAGLWRPLDTLAGWLGGPWTVEGRALSMGVPSVWIQAQDVRDAARLATHEPDLLIVGNFGLILKPALLSVPKVGAVNAHWSLLPLHRGPHPSTSVLLCGDSQTGLTFHEVTPRIDGGDILDQVALPIGPDDTSTSLYHRACAEAERRIVALVDRIEREGLCGQPQDLSLGSYHRRTTVEGATLDFTQDADALDRKVRALVKPMPRFTWKGRTVFVTAARPIGGVDAEPGTIVSIDPGPVVACGRGGLRIAGAWTQVPPMVWPPPWGGVKVGQVLE
ncbi:MAG: methionyl-tRNA formyltransferase [Myxococcota bacterium]